MRSSNINGELRFPSQPPTCASEGGRIHSAWEFKTNQDLFCNCATNKVDRLEEHLKARMGCWLMEHGKHSLTLTVEPV